MPLIRTIYDLGTQSAGELVRFTPRAIADVQCASILAVPATAFPFPDFQFSIFDFHILPT